MLRLKFSNADIKYVTTLVAEHMFIPRGNRISNKTFLKHFARLEDARVSIEDYTVLLYSDSQANLKNPRIKFGDFINNHSAHKKYYELKNSNNPFRISGLAISGHDLIDAGIPVGVEIGETLNNIYSQVVDGDLKNERNTLMYYLKHGSELPHGH